MASQNYFVAARIDGGRTSLTNQPVTISRQETGQPLTVHTKDGQIFEGDKLTIIPNRSFNLSLLELNDGENKQSSLAVTLLDKDNFKEQEAEGALKPFILNFMDDHNSESNYFSAPSEAPVALSLNDRPDGKPDRKVEMEIYPFTFKSNDYEIDFTKDESNNTIVGKIKDPLASILMERITDFQQFGPAILNMVNQFHSNRS